MLNLKCMAVHVVLGLSVVVNLAMTQQIDPCNDAVNIGSDKRSRDYVTDPNQIVLCDYHRIREGDWYRFDAHTGNKMATSCVGPYFCGTYDTMHMNGDMHPTSSSPGPVTASVCVNDGSKCCARTHTISVKWCFDNSKNLQFFAYKLAKPIGCDTAYCVGSGQPCPNGHYYNSVNGSCMDGYPAMSSFPTLEGPTEPDDPYKDTFEFHCRVSYDGDVAGAYFEIQWFSDNHTLITEEVVNASNPVGVLKEKQLIGHLGKHILCTARSYWDGSPNRSPFMSCRDPYWVGITGKRTTIYGSDEVSEIELYSTIPITSYGCRINYNLDAQTIERQKSFCRFHFSVDPDPYGRNKNSLSCRLTFQPGNQSAIVKVSEVKAFRTIPQLQELHFAKNKNSRSLWLNYTISPIQIIVAEHIGSKMCYSVTDPHYKTFDGSLFDIYEPGNYLMVKSSAKRIFEVQTHLRKCQNRDWVSCNCGVAVREGNTIIGVDNCKELGSEFRTFKKVLSSDWKDGIGTLNPDATGTKMTITMPSGARVEAIEDKYWHMNIYVYLPSEDFQKTEGLCGSWDNNAGNDFKIYNSSIVDNLKGRRPIDFTNSYRLNKTESFFDGTPECRDTEFGINFCTCDPAKTDFKTIYCTPQPEDTFDMRVTDVCNKNKGKKRKRQINSLSAFFNSFADMKPETNFTVLGNISWPTASGITEQQAQDKCMSIFGSSSVFSQCIGLNNFDISATTDECKGDILIADDLSAGETMLDVFQSNCLDTAQQSVIIGAANQSTTLDIVNTIEKNICVRQCSGNGTCVNSICNCYSGFFGADCSVPAGVAPKLIEMEIVCDWRTNTCEQIKITATPLISNLTCRWKELESITKQETGVVYTSNSTLISKTKTFCAVPDSRSQALSIYSFSIAIDGQTFSQEKEVTLFDSKCKQCDTSGSCSSKPDTCALEDGKCYDGLICTACDNAVSIGHPKRSSVYQTKSTDIYLCDAHRITKGNYYWFDQYTGNQISEVCVDEYHCSTINPVWLNGTHPTEDEPVKEVDVCANVNSDCCHWRDKVTIRYCKTLSNVTFYAYQLPPTPFCDWAYCSGSTMPCNDSTQWDASTNQCVDINECLSNPCVNGNCTNLQGKFECQCVAGFAGTRCELNINDCSPNPCIQGSCTDMVNGYQCSCSLGYTGNNCDQNIEECASNPCGTNGTCVDGVNKYTCTCDAGYTGVHCTEGQWNSWLPWATCSVSCDYGNSIRTRSCMVEQQKCTGDSSEYQVCKLATCSGSSSGTGSSTGSGASFDVPKENLTAIVTNENGLKVAIANSINTYCIEDPNACCTALGVAYTRQSPPNSGTALTSASMINIKNNGPSNGDTTINFIITVNVTSNTAASFCQDSASPSGQNGAFKMTNTFVSDAIHANKGKISKETGIVISDTGKQGGGTTIPSNSDTNNGGGSTNNVTVIIIGVVCSIIGVGIIITIISAVCCTASKKNNGSNGQRPLSVHSARKVTGINELARTPSTASANMFTTDYGNGIISVGPQAMTYNFEEYRPRTGVKRANALEPLQHKENAYESAKRNNPNTWS